MSGKTWLYYCLREQDKGYKYNMLACPLLFTMGTHQEIKPDAWKIIEHEALQECAVCGCVWFFMFSTPLFTNDCGPRYVYGGIECALCMIFFLVLIKCLHWICIYHFVYYDWYDWSPKVYKAIFFIWKASKQKEQA